MSTQNVTQLWEGRLAREKMPVYLGYEAEQHGKERHRVLSLDVYPDLAEDSLVWAVWDEYALDSIEEHDVGERLIEVVPKELRAIGEKRMLGMSLTSTERKKLQRFREGTYTGRRGRPKNVTQANQALRDKNTHSSNAILVPSTTSAASTVPRAPKVPTKGGLMP